MLCKKSIVFQTFAAWSKSFSSTRINNYHSMQYKKLLNPSLFPDPVTNKVKEVVQCLPRSVHLHSVKHDLLINSKSSTSQLKLISCSGENCGFLLRAPNPHRCGYAHYNTDEHRAYVSFLNREEHAPLMVDSYSQHGFRMNSGLAVVGAIVLFPRSLMSWNVGSASDINRESLSLFHMLVPKLDLVVLGIGDPGSKFDISLLPFMRNKGISLEVLPTEKAVATYNFLTEEGRSVAGAFIPPYNIKHTVDDEAQAIMRRRDLFDGTIEDEFI